MAQDALQQGVPCAVYSLSVRISAERRRRAAEYGVPIREYRVFHSLLHDLLRSAGLPGPARELAGMRDDGATGSRT